MPRRASGTPKKHIPKRKNNPVDRRRVAYVEAKVPEVEEVFDAMVENNYVAPLIRQMIIIRIMRGITRDQLALACGIKKDAVTMIELGRKLPTLGLLIRMAYVLKGRIEFVGWMDDPALKRRSEIKENENQDS